MESYRSLITCLSFGFLPLFHFRFFIALRFFEDAGDVFCSRTTVAVGSAVAVVDVWAVAARVRRDSTYTIPQPLLIVPRKGVTIPLQPFGAWDRPLP
ncbi:hypothetical protein P152DRAFT_208374 [Eremomyces bilateralis CBS 781.70]|uniref:Uncharacterized protein n=1 Tax=Eremomyces bilateralis CBS 781.70 TaxID=1392243 RepID=A0A6G1FSW5_9PEZI|nr:uncharacterized protein P152DRAFT_208374 [Eremomyces bilateralis CBS 781.70]KAF1808769.1 hypothetical protein P152DRAFT_208374 [Eremomyces bilateralis CBS 781.70]